MFALFLLCLDECDNNILQFNICKMNYNSECHWMYIENDLHKKLSATLTEYC